MVFTYKYFENEDAVLRKKLTEFRSYVIVIHHIIINSKRNGVPLLLSLLGCTKNFQNFEFI